MSTTAKNIATLISEHDNIRRMLKILEKFSLEFLNNPDMDLSFYDKFIDFTKNYADKHHHGKEELILFDYMTKHSGPLANKLVTNGMLVEHDLGRMHMSNLISSLDSYRQTKTDYDRLIILSSSMAYADLLKRHTDKEDSLVFPFAERSLSKDLMSEVETQSDSFEAEHSARKAHYEAMLDDLEKTI